MKFYLKKTNLHLRARTCKKPTFKNHRGRVWKTGNVIIDGKQTSVHLDTNYSENIYFQFGHKANTPLWWRLEIFTKAEKGGVTVNTDIGIDPNAHTPAELVTSKVVLKKEKVKEEVEV